MKMRILFYVINEDLQYYLVPIGVVFLMIWFLLTKVALLMNKVDVGWKKLLPWATLGAFYSIVGRAFIPGDYFYFLYIGIIFTSVLIIAKVPLVQALLTAVSTFLFTFAGLIILEPFVRFNPSLNRFFSQVPLSVVICGFIEMVFPLILLYILKYNPHFLVRKKWQKSELLGIILFGLLFFEAYSAIATYVFLMADVPHLSLLSFFSLQFILLTAALLIFLFKRECRKSEQQEAFWEQMQQQLEQSSALISSLSSEQREFKNKLQVVKGLVELGKNEDSLNYINRITTELINTEVIEFDNPIVSSAILEEIVQARELGTEIRIKTDTSLRYIPDSIKIGRALKVVISYFLNNTGVRKARIKGVMLIIERMSGSYRFTVQYEYEDVQPQLELVGKGRHELGEVEGLLKDATFTYRYFNEVLISFSFQIPVVVSGEKSLETEESPKFDLL